MSEADGVWHQGDGGRGGPLEGVTVVALEQAVAVPFATRQLADLGARVIKIERSGRGDFARDYDSAAGDGMSSWFVWLNRSKESVVLDLKTGADRQILERLISQADVFVSNLSPRAINKLGFDADSLSARHPRLVICELSGYGDGPYANRKAYDLLVQAETGVVAVTGAPGAPAKVGISIADIAGGMYAYSGILSALLQRQRTGHGSVVRLSLFASLAEWMSHPLLLTQLTGKPPRRSGARHATIAPYGAYTTADGDEILLAVQNEREWRRLCESALELSDLVSDDRFSSNERRVAHREEMDQMLSRAIAELPTEELVRRLENAEIAYASLASVDQVLTHPQLAGRWMPVTAGARKVNVLVPPVSHSDFAPRFGPVPTLGQDTVAVRTELRDVSSAEVDSSSFEDRSSSCP